MQLCAAVNFLQAVSSRPKHFGGPGWDGELLTCQNASYRDSPVTAKMPRPPAHTSAKVRYRRHSGLLYLLARHTTLTKVVSRNAISSDPACLPATGCPLGVCCVMIWDQRLGRMQGA